MNNLKYRVTVEFQVPADEPLKAAEKLEALKQVGHVDTNKIIATRVKAEE